MRLLILSNRPADEHRRALLSLIGAAGSHAEPTIAESGAFPLDPGAFDTIVIDGKPPEVPEGDLRLVEDFVAVGGTLCVVAPPPDLSRFWTDLLGVRQRDQVLEGEYFARVVDPGVGARIDEEFAFSGSFAPAEALPGTETLVAVNVGYRDHALLSSIRRGRGLALFCGAPAAMAAPTLLAPILRRALAGLSGATPGPAIGVGIVGYGPFGGMGYYHGLGISGTAGLELVAVADSRDDRRKAAENDFAGVGAYATVDELASDPAVDLAFVATPPSAHFEIAQSLLRSGKHVACEKPLCLTVSHADELVRLAAEGGRVLTVHQNRRWDADFMALRRAVDAGLLGELFNVETFVGGFEHPCRAWHSDVAVSGGAVYDWGSHHVDWILQLLGSAPARVTTFGHKRVWHDVTNLDQLRLHMSWQDGREAEFFQSDIAGVRRPKFFVQGTAGTLVGRYRPLSFDRIEPGHGLVTERPHHAEAPAELILARYESGYGLTETRLPAAPGRPFAFHRNLADHLHLGEPLAVTPESIRAVVSVLEASQRSSDEGGRVVEIGP